MPSGRLAGDLVWNELYEKLRAVGDAHKVSVGGEECSVSTYGACGNEGVRGRGRDASPAAGVANLGCEKVVFPFHEQEGERIQRGSETLELFRMSDASEQLLVDDAKEADRLVFLDEGTENSGRGILSSIGRPAECPRPYARVNDDHAPGRVRARL